MAHSPFAPLRDFYGSFAPHCADSKKLSEVLPDLDAASLTLLVRDYKSGRPEKICQLGRIHVEWAMPKRPDLDRRI
jgi:hypothetical protein